MKSEEMGNGRSRPSDLQRDEQLMMHAYDAVGPGLLNSLTLKHKDPESEERNSGVAHLSEQ